MSARGRMTMRATVQRNMAAGMDPYNNPLPPDWQVLHASLPCWAWSTAGRELVEAERTAVIEDLRMMVPKKTDIKVQDRIAQVTDRLGAVLYGVLQIEAVQRRIGHVEIVLKAVN